MKEYGLKLIMNREDLDRLELGDVVGVDVRCPVVPFSSVRAHFDILIFGGYKDENLILLEHYTNIGDSIVKWTIPKKRIDCNIGISMRVPINVVKYIIYLEGELEYSIYKDLMQESGVI